MQLHVGKFLTFSGVVKIELTKLRFDVSYCILCRKFAIETLARDLQYVEATLIEGKTVAPSKQRQDSTFSVVTK